MCRVMYQTSTETCGLNETKDILQQNNEKLTIGKTDIIGSVINHKFNFHYHWFFSQIKYWNEQTSYSTVS